MSTIVLSAESGSTILKGISAAASAFPTVKVLASLAAYGGALHPFIAAAGATAQFVSAYQNTQIAAVLRDIEQQLAVQNSLVAPGKFAKIVHAYIRSKAQETKDHEANNYYFLYHPDTDWHALFYELVQHKEPLPKNFYGMSDDLNGLCLWMRFIRRVIKKTRQDQVTFHLLMPSYRFYDIQEPVEFDDTLKPLYLHCEKHNSMPYVRINVPDSQRGMLRRVEVWERPAGVWEKVGLQKPPQRTVLGWAPSEADRAIRRSHIPRARKRDHAF
ncbi:hypothetical protein D8B26_001138 [Coccidioides posadasii str. Silveira]|nr:hypothetical protein CPC735_038580 [Coccidioides posadasii C735 delta SOWgp]KMM64321.1 hypothetical protein CPAG_00673 [Coccidioides posadasii RMSCC 3488]KMU75115.1 hypothetical protein CISG_04402 [Coccidioides immitis RMSCC 3703]KMU90190.1 hypothetical protein CIHG_08000 [Coccidioides immitis H538.4]QVM06426.1 hypothetical protein D8B26_001138 [Coccidioides posadasii str. Silveira]EER28594.1 hypothetical protein CPC735_038580 [Coccidioides posadasii C735 delta SOWgp]|eukprot:XP_003070739.1 hypothetical protein CPC735_038580 [Coccidioides posadasii C735 delta SOWgp]